jgi:hypothetical protein
LAIRYRVNPAIDMAMRVLDRRRIEGAKKSERRPFALTKSSVQDRRYPQFVTVLLVSNQADLRRAALRGRQHFGHGDTARLATADESPMIVACHIGACRSRSA